MTTGMSEEAFKSALARDGELDPATLTVGDRVTVNAPCAFVEWELRRIESVLTTEAGFAFMAFGFGDGLATVLVSAATPVTVKWPKGYVPFEQPNPLLGEIEHS